MSCTYILWNTNFCLFYYALIYLSLLFLSPIISASQCDELPVYLRNDKVSVGHFPSMTTENHRVFSENGKTFTKKVGLGPGLFSAMIAIAPRVLLEYPTMDEKTEKHLPFHSNCPAMFELNIGICRVEDDCVPDSKTFYRKNKATLAHVLQHMAFVVTTNSGLCSEEIPASYLKPPTTELMQRFDEDGTELSTLENPNFPEVHYIAFKRVYSHNLLLLHQQLKQDFPDHLGLSKPTFRDLDSPPARAWSNIYKRMILRIEKHGVYGAWDEIGKGNDSLQKFNGPLLASEFFLIWPFLVGCVNTMKFARRKRLHDCIKGSSAVVVRDLVKFFHLQGYRYPINMSKNKDLLKMSLKSDEDMQRSKVTMSAEMKKKIAQCRKDAVRYKSGYGKPIPLRHVYKENSDLGKHDDTHNLF